MASIWLRWDHLVKRTGPSTFRLLLLILAPGQWALQALAPQFFTQSLDPVRRYPLPSSTLPNTLILYPSRSLRLLYGAKPRHTPYPRPRYLSVPYQADYHSITSSDHFRYRHCSLPFLLLGHYPTLASPIRARH